MQMRNGLVLCVAALAMFMMATETEASAIRRAVSRRGIGWLCAGGDERSNPGCRGRSQTVAAVCVPPAWRR